MIGKILKAGSFGSKVDYVTREKHDKTIFTPDTWRILGSNGLLGEKRNLILASFEGQAMLNPKISDPAGHIVLSFSPDDKPGMTDAKMLKIATDYIKQMGLDKTQWLLVRHYETDCPHCHIVFNMVGDDGTRMESGRNRYKNKRVCEALTKRYRLALPKQANPDIGKLHGLERAKAEIRQAAQEALKDALDWHTFAALLARKNIHVVPKYRRGTTEIQGVSFQMGDNKVKGSDLGEQFKFRNLDSYFKDGQTTERPIPQYEVRQEESESGSRYSVLDDAKSAVCASAEFAIETVETITEGVGSFLSDLIKPGNGQLNEDEMRMAWEMSHPKKKRVTKRKIKN